MMRGTVGVAPGSYTLQLGAPMTYAPNSWQMNMTPIPCPPDEVGTAAYGVPSWNWYGYTLPPIQTAAQASSIVMQPLNPYGTQSILKGLGAVLPQRTIAPQSLLVPNAPSQDTSLLPTVPVPIWKRWYVIVPAIVGAVLVGKKLLASKRAKP